MSGTESRLGPRPGAPAMSLKPTGSHGSPAGSYQLGCLASAGSADLGPHTPRGRGCARRVLAQGAGEGVPLPGEAAEGPSPLGGPHRSHGSRGPGGLAHLCTQLWGAAGQGRAPSLRLPTWGPARPGCHRTPVSRRGRPWAEHQLRASGQTPPLPLGTSWVPPSSGRSRRRRRDRDRQRAASRFLGPSGSSR